MNLNQEKPKILQDPLSVGMEKQKMDFILRNLVKVTPVIEGDKRAKEILKNVVEKKAVANEELDYLLEKFETKVFLLEKPEGEYESDAKKVLLYASDPLAYKTMNSIMEALKKDPKCRGIGLITDGVAGRDFENSLQAQSEDIKIASYKGGHEYKEEENKKNVPLLFDALQSSKKGGKFDVAFTIVDSYNTPSSLSFRASKSNFGADKLFLIYSGWTGFGRKDLFENKGTGKDTSDEIDGIFCNDELAKQIIKYNFPSFQEDKISVTGTPIIDEVILSDIEKYRKDGREKLGLGKNELAILYVGDVDEDDNANIDKDANLKTFKLTVDAAIKLSEQQGEKEFVLLVRPHPRDPRKEEMLNYINTEIKLPKNLKIISATNDSGISMEEARCASDVTASIQSTENNLASMMGKPGVFLGYKQPKSEPGLGHEMLIDSFGGEKVLDLFKENKNITIVSSPDEFTECLKECEPFSAEDYVDRQKSGEENSAEKILNIALKKK